MNKPTVPPPSEGFSTQNSTGAVLAALQREVGLTSRLSASLTRQEEEITDLRSLLADALRMAEQALSPELRRRIADKLGAIALPREGACS